MTRRSDRPRRQARALTFAVTGAFAVAAVHLLPSRGPMPVTAPVAAVTALPPRPSPWQRVDTLKRGETLSQLLERAGLGPQDARTALGAADGLDHRRVPAGMTVTLRNAAGDSTPAEITLQLAIDRLLHLTRGDSGWTGREERLPWTTDTVVVSGEIRTTLYDAIAEAAAEVLPARARGEVAWTLADVYEYRVDMSRDLQVGDRFRVLLERSVGPGGLARAGPILAARLELRGSVTEAIRFGTGKRGEFYDQDGKSLRAAFLRAPLEFRRISSVFGMRRHPILRSWKAHKGTDYAAASGTPVRAIGDGTVIYAGWRGGYGNTLEIRHRNGYVSRYAHLRGFARGARRGARVGIGETVAYVGSTGMSTAPHLHFEVLVNGVQRDPRKALDFKSGLPIDKASRARFDAHRALMLAALDGGVGGAQLAQR